MNGPLCLAVDTDTRLVKVCDRGLCDALPDFIHQGRYKACTFLDFVYHSPLRQRYPEHAPDSLVNMVGAESVHAQVHDQGIEVLTILDERIHALRELSFWHPA